MKVEVVAISSDNHQYKCTVEVEVLLEINVKVAFEESLKNVKGEDWTGYGYKIK